MSAELISVVLCTYNGEHFLDQQLQSILTQTYSNLEIIIFDDASTDGTKLILQKYQQQPNIQVHFNEKNIGFTKNFEQAVLATNANYICFADQDDIWLQKKIELLYQHIKHYSLIYSNSLLIDENGKSLNKYLSDFRKLQNINNSKGFVFSNAVTGHTMMMKREVLEKAIPLPVTCYHDWWFAIIAANLNGIYYFDKVLTHYRQHTTTVTKTIITHKSGSRTTHKRYADFLELQNWIDVIRKNKVEKNVPFFNQLYTLFSAKANGKFVWSLFWFLLLNRKFLFSFSIKKYFSQLVEIRKLSRGEYYL